jgi:hypothetical protein
MGYVSTLMRIQLAFEKAGISFLDNEPGAGSGFDLRGQRPNHRSFVGASSCSLIRMSLELIPAARTDDSWGFPNR